jgi:hypothetical protein
MGKKESEINGTTRAGEHLQQARFGPIVPQRPPSRPDAIEPFFMLGGLNRVNEGSR